MGTRFQCPSGPFPWPVMAPVGLVWCLAPQGYSTRLVIHASELGTLCTCDPGAGSCSRPVCGVNRVPSHPFNNLPSTKRNCHVHFSFPADLFDILLPMLNIYQEFVRNHQYSLQVLANCKQNRDFDKLLKQYEANPACEGRMLETFLTYPMFQVRHLGRTV